MPKPKSTIIQKLFDQEREQKKQRIEQLKKFPPQATMIVEHDTHQTTVGFWRVEGGVFTTESNVHGDFDINGGTFYPYKVIETFEKVRNMELKENQL